MSPRVDFHSGLFDHEVIEDLDFAGRGFRISFRHTSTPVRVEHLLAPDGGVSVPIAGGKFKHFGPPREAMIHTSEDRARQIGNLLHASLALVKGGLILLVESIEPYRKGDPPASPASTPRFYSTAGIALSAAVAATVSQRKALTVATCRLSVSYQAMSVHHMDLHPSLGHSFKIEQDPVSWVTLAQAVTTAFGAIEDLNLKVMPVEGKAPKKDSAWDPAARRIPEQRSQNRGIDPTTEVAWLDRGTPTRLSRKSSAPTGKPANWSRGSNRDRLVNVMDALNYAQYIRNHAGAHAFTKLTRSLTVTEVSNVQRLARELILRSTKHWHVVTGARPLKGTVGAWAGSAGRGAARK